MPNWSGLFDGVHGSPHTLLVDRPPMRGVLRILLQRRGIYGYADTFGGTVPATRKRVDPELPLGGTRMINDDATVPDATAGEVDEVADTTLKHTYVADLSGNGGPAF